MISLADYDQDFLEMSWKWLNDPEVKELTMTPDFTREQQQDFYRKLGGRTDYWIKGVTTDRKPVGVLGLKNIDKNSAEYWGYIGEKEYWGKGIGSFMINAAIEHAKQLGLQEIYLLVGKTNDRARQFYIRKGFRLDTEGAIEKYVLEL